MAEECGDGLPVEIVTDFELLRLLDIPPSELAALTYAQAQVLAGCAEGEAIAEWARRESERGDGNG